MGGCLSLSAARVRPDVGNDNAGAGTGSEATTSSAEAGSRASAQLQIAEAPATESSAQPATKASESGFRRLVAVASVVQGVFVGTHALWLLHCIVLFRPTLRMRWAEPASTPVVDLTVPQHLPALKSLHASGRAFVGLRVMVVDDEATNRRLCQRMLQRLGCQVRRRATYCDVLP